MANKTILQIAILQVVEEQSGFYLETANHLVRRSGDKFQVKYIWFGLHTTRLSDWDSNLH